MTEQARLSSDLVTRFIETSQELVFPCLEEEGKNFIVKLGLVPEEGDEWSALELPEIAPNGGIIVINNREELGQIWMDLTTGSRNPEPEFRQFLDDVFAETTALVTAKVGKPSKRKRGKIPEIHWSLANGGRLVLYSGGKVNLRVDSPWTITLDSVVW